MNTMELHDGIHKMVPTEKMSKGAAKLRTFYDRKPNARIYQREFAFFTVDRWKREGHINDESELYSLELFGFDEEGILELGQLGGCEAPFYPVFEKKIIEDRGRHEVVLDSAGRHVLYFKGRRDGFMPEYLDHPVKDKKTWEENCKWRLDTKTAGRYSDLEERMEKARNCAGKGMVISQNIVGAYMYLRSLIGPVDLLFKFYDDPSLIHDCMQTWFEIADAICSKHQEYVTFDEVGFDEDISYNHGLLISPSMVRKFLFPYYSQLINNIKQRQIDKSRKLHIRVDSDGFAEPVVQLYQEMGLDCFCPFEVASGSDVVKIGKEYPELLMIGGIDKRVLAEGMAAIDAAIERIMPAMQKRGGYIPTCDHGVPEEVSFENYMHYRKRMLEFS